MKDFFALLLFAIIVVIIIAIPVGLIAYWFGAAQCDAQWFEFGHRFDVWAGCMVEYEGTWYPQDILRSVIEP